MLQKAIFGTAALAVVGCEVAKLFKECDEEKCNAIQNDIEEKMQEIELQMKEISKKR